MRTSGTFEAFPLEKVWFGEPAEHALIAEVDRLGAKRVFLLVSESLDRNTDEVAKLRAALGGRFAGQASGMPSHTPRDAVLRFAAAAREGGADLLVAFGGGSLTDAGKMVALCLQHEIDDIDGFDRFRTVIHADGRREAPSFRGPTVRQIVIPTTLSGGEFNVTAGCTDPRGPVKQLYRHPLLVSRAVILDPAPTVHTPEWLWLSTGIRAVDHAVETVCSPLATWQADGPALHALRLLSRGLTGVKHDPGDLAARLDCQMGVWLSMDHNQGGVPMGASHGIGHVLGGSCKVPHGHTSCVMLPSVLRWNREANADRQALVADAMGTPGEDAADVIERFVSGLGLPTRLSEVGVGPESFDLVARHAMHDRYIHTNPRPIKGPEDVRAILEMAA